MRLTEKEVKSIFDQYFDGKLKEDPEFVDHVTDSWVFDAEDWFWETYDLPDWNDPKDKPKELSIFGQYALKRFHEQYQLQFGKRDAMEYLPTFGFKVSVLAEEFRCELKPYIDDWKKKDAIELKFNELNDLISELINKNK